MIQHRLATEEISSESSLLIFLSGGEVLFFV